MKDQDNIYKIKSLISFVLVLTTSLFFMACTKQAVQPVDENHDGIQNFHLSESRVTLLEGNAKHLAISFRWDGGINANTVYTLEAAVGGTSFAEPINMESTDQTVLGFTVKDLNALMCELLYANNTGSVEFRVRVDHLDPKSTVAYSKPVALDVTTYQTYTEYDESKTLRIPGNYQNWVISTAPKIVSAENPGEYEGYINFTNQYPQVLLVKGNAWDTKNTYTYIGADKFGFGGSMMSVFGGEGVYLFKANTNTNKWSYTKINCWGITGSAVQANNQDPLMKKGDTPLSWTITTNLAKGSFRLRANNNDAISFGHKAGDEAGVPSYTGDNIVIKTSGSYTIQLELQLAGNYAYSIQKNG